MKVTKEQMDEAKRQAMLHWKYIDELLETHLVSETEREITRFDYISAFVHGWKHGIESLEEK